MDGSADADCCICIGYHAGENNTADNLVAIGHNAAQVNTGIAQTAVGYFAGNALTTGVSNCLLGFQSGMLLTTGNHNTFLGTSCGENTAIGVEANTAIGYHAGRTITNNSCTAIGYMALQSSSGAYNVAIGYNTMDDIVTGIKNTGCGTFCLSANTSGAENTSCGYRALAVTTTGTQNTAVGALAGDNVAVDINGCVYLGYDAGSNNTVANTLYINNSNSAFPLIYGEFGNDIVKIGNNNDAFFFKFSHDANDAIVETEATNRNIYLKPHGTGLVKWGTEVVNAGSDRGKLIAMKTAAGTTVYLKTYDTV